MDRILEDNLSFLSVELRNRLLSPDDCVARTFYTPGGLPVTEIETGGKSVSLHSRFDPVKEASRFISEISDFSFDLFVVYGFASAYHIEKLLEHAAKNSNVLVIERSPSVLKNSLAARDLRGILSDPRLLICADPDDSEFAELLRGKSTNRVTFIFHRGSSQVFGDYYLNINNTIKTYFSDKEVNIATLAKFERLWSANSSRNIMEIVKCRPVNIFFGQFIDIPAIIVCAGPSLSRSIDFIRQNSAKALIIAVDTAYYLLKKHSIDPHFCVCVDPQIINARYFEKPSDTNAVLIADPSTHPSVFRFFTGRKAMISSIFANVKWIEQITGEKGEVTHGGSVSTNAFDFALKTGANPVIMTGQDLSFTDNLAHARGSYLDEQMHYRTNRFFSEQDFNRKQLSALPKVFLKGIKKREIFTNQKMLIFKNWFEKHADKKLINATADGVVLSGITHAEADTIDLGNEKDVPGIISMIYSSAPGGDEHIEAVKNRFERIFNELDSYLERTSKARVISQKLIEAVKKSNHAEIRRIIPKLDELDSYLESRKTVCDIIGLSMQRTIHTVTEGYENDNEKNLSDDMKVALKSHRMYGAMEESLRFNMKLASKMKTFLGL